MKLFIEKLRLNPYIDSKDFFAALNDDDKEIFLASIFDIFTQKNIIFSKFLESHPYFESYLLKQNLAPFNLTFLQDDMNVIYAAMRQSQDFLPSIIYKENIDSKNIINIIAFEPFSSSFRNNIAGKILQNLDCNLQFFLAKQSFLNEIKNIIDMQKMAEINELDEDLLESLLILAQKFSASDIHLTMQNSQNSLDSNTDSACFFRINGNLVHFLNLHNDLFFKLSKKLKLLCKVNINDKEMPQDGHFKSSGEFKNIKSLQQDIRISFLPTLKGESIVLRVPSINTTFHDLDKLEMSRDVMLSLKKNLSAKSGLIIISGPTNSAKTTLLYACLRHLNSGTRKILSVEDPIEQEISGIAQCEVNKNENLSFANALKYILRQDGDVIMVGEIRDKETLELALKAALSGHLVLASIHANSCVSSIARMLDLNAQKSLLDSVLKCVISQRLVKTLCPYCKEQKGKFFVPKGCYKCYYQGFGMRKLLQEMIDFRGLDSSIESSDNFIESSLLESSGEIHANLESSLESNTNPNKDSITLTPKKLENLESKIDYVLSLQDSKKITKPYFSKSLQAQAKQLYNDGFISYEESLL